MFKRLIYCSTCDRSVQRSRTICAMLIEGIMRNISMNLFVPGDQEEMSFKDISIFSLGGIFVQQSITLCAV